MRRKYEIMIFGSLFVLVLDQLTKLAVLARFRNRQSLDLIDNLLSFTFVGNDGAAFGLFSGFHINFFLIVSFLPSDSFCIFSGPSSRIEKC